MGEPAISCVGLTKDYGSGRGVFDLDLTVEAGEIFGFIGPNGAGKTTTIRLLMDFVRADRGSSRVLGLDTRKGAIAIKRSVGYMPGELPSYPGVTAGQIIELLAHMRGGVDQAFVRRLADRLKLDLGRKYRDLSHGNKQKVWLVQALMHRPRLLILDEPTLGLDPLIQAELHGMLKESVAGGATVFLSSHVLPEVQSLCSRIGILSDGHLLRAGTLAQLREFRLHRVDALLKTEVDAQALAALPGVSQLAVADHHVRCMVREPFEPLLAALLKAGIAELDSEELSLEEVFLASYRNRAA